MTRSVQDSQASDQSLTIRKALASSVGRAKLKDMSQSQALRLRARGAAINSVGVLLGVARHDPAMVYGASARAAVYGDRDLEWLKENINSPKDPDTEPFDKTRFATDSSGINSLILSNITGLGLAKAFTLSGLPHFLNIKLRHGHSNPDADARMADIVSTLPALLIGGTMGTSLNKLYIKKATHNAELKQIARLETLEYLNSDEGKKQIKNLDKNSKNQSIITSVKNEIQKNIQSHLEKSKVLAHDEDMQKMKKHFEKIQPANNFYESNEYQKFVHSLIAKLGNKIVKPLINIKIKKS